MIMYLWEFYVIQKKQISMDLKQLVFLKHLF